MSTISINRAIDIIKNSGERFEIEFVRSTGKKKGSIKKCICIYGAPNPTIKTEVSKPKTDPSPYQKQTFKMSGSLPLTDVSNKRLTTPLISHIIKLNKSLVKH